MEWDIDTMVLYAGLDNSPAETAVFMSFGSIISLNMAYLFGEIWEDMNITKTGIKASG
jgi:urea transporter